MTAFCETSASSSAMYCYIYSTDSPVMLSISIYFTWISGFRPVSYYLNIFLMNNHAREACYVYLLRKSAKSSRCKLAILPAVPFYLIGAYSSSKHPRINKAGNQSKLISLQISQHVTHNIIPMQSPISKCHIPVSIIG